MRSPVRCMLPGRLDRTKGKSTRFPLVGFFEFGADSQVTVTSVPSGKAGPPSNTTTPLCTRPRIVMRSLSRMVHEESSEARIMLSPAAQYGAQPFRDDRVLARFHHP